MFKAVLKYDIHYGMMPVYTYNPETRNFEHGTLHYPYGMVMEDPAWQVFATDGSRVFPVQKLAEDEEPEIYGFIEKPWPYYK